jgi:predicted nucleic-acid-binding protein
VIAVDTNVLLRFALQDDAEQAEAASRFMAEIASTGEAVFVGLITLVEFAWVLEDAYGVSKDAVAEAVATLLSEPSIVIEQEEAVRRALGLPHGDFSDRIIHFVGLAAGCSKTVTFDRRFARLDGVELLEVG